MTTAIKSKLTPQEAAELAHVEKAIEAGLETFVEVGVALAVVMDKRLYRENYSSFNEYLEKRWKISKNYAYRLIEAAETVKALPLPIGKNVTTESQARELAKVPAPARAKVIKAAAKAGPVTAKAIKEAAAKVAPPPPVEEPVDAGDACVWAFKALRTNCHQLLEQSRTIASTITQVENALTTLAQHDKAEDIKQLQARIPRLRELLNMMELGSWTITINRTIEAANDRLLEREGF